MVLNFHSLVLSWEANSGFLKKQYVLLISEKSLQPRSPSFLFFETEFLTEPGIQFCRTIWAVRSPRGPYVPPSLVLELQAHTTKPDCVCVRDPDLGPYPCVTNILLTDSSFQPLSIIHFIWNKYILRIGTIRFNKWSWWFEKHVLYGNFLLSFFEYPF